MFHYIESNSMLIYYALCSMLCQMNNYESSEKKNVYSCCCFVFGISANF